MMENIDRHQDTEINSLSSRNRSLRSYQFSTEELSVLKECNRDSFFQRSLPICALFSGGIYYGIKSGLLQGHPKYGATPKIVVALIVGYFAGKFSYQRKCMEKLMLLPNSRLGEMLRQKKSGHLQETLEPGLSLAPFGTISDAYTDIKRSNTLDIDVSRPDISGLDENHRPSLDNPIYEEEMPPVQKHTTTYEELRNQNREEYQNKFRGNYRDNYPRSASSREQSPESFTKHTATNKYGDAME
ncbi:hypothetical protein FQA39_LY11496 [Lamprigera yunnana]|nr:hypothetical protein FQA39_LY11496 [Lamprigera yunnana]